MATIPEALAAALEHHQAGRLQLAEQIYRQIVAVEPNHVDALHLLGVVSHQIDQRLESIEYIQRAIQLNGNVAAFHNSLGNVFKAHQRGNDAAAAYRRAIELKPDYVETHFNLGNALRDQGKLVEAVDSYRHALEHSPEFAKAYLNLGNTLGDLGKIHEAILCYQQALRLNPSYVNAHLNLAFAWLMVGNWEQGWPAYEWRWQEKGKSPRLFSQPVWDGQSLEDKTILLHAEQGLGDTIHFIRFAPILKQRGATVIVECQKPLLRLLAHCPGIDQCIGQGSELPAFDVHSPLLSLPAILKLSLETCPANVPYIHPPVSLVEQWRERLSTLDGFKVGIIWQGNANYRSDQLRSFPLRHFAPLAQLPGVRLISLQKGDGTEQLAEVHEQFAVLDLAAELDQHSGPFVDTAAVMKNLDLVITPNTASAHLAGALGVPVWVALRFAPDWRWLLDRSDSPWYPTMRLFRQQEAGNWEGVFAAMQQALCERLASS